MVSRLSGHLSKTLMYNCAVQSLAGCIPTGRGGTRTLATVRPSGHSLDHADRPVKGPVHRTAAYMFV
ncbi:hypothetical protein BDV25DRAFT_147243 [Aspergillus avenaceus]|uniref:Uncharacterized protein n=1 Tax=Aspergillus avenaceus TaxID=36643 RepID=A0A5N6U7T5_ASPAV|nr:hypothetical protein BDV25DRAFT_147243 [Aspergillus avenaceus]